MSGAASVDLPWSMSAITVGYGLTQVVTATAITTCGSTMESMCDKSDKSSRGTATCKSRLSDNAPATKSGTTH